MDRGDGRRQEPISGRAEAWAELYRAAELDGADAEGGEAGGAEGDRWLGRGAAGRTPREGHDGESSAGRADEGTGSVRCTRSRRARNTRGCAAAAGGSA